MDQLEGVDAIIVPVGGGTLLAGTCVAVKTLYPSIKIIVSLFQIQLSQHTVKSHFLKVISLKQNQHWDFVKL